MSIYGAVAREVTKLNEIRDRQTQEGMITSTSAAISTENSGSSSALPRSQTNSNGGRTRTKSADDHGKSADDHAEDADKLSRRLSTLSTASTATARGTGQGDAASGRDMTASPVQEDEEEEEELLSESASAVSSRVPSVLSTPADERSAQLDAFHTREGYDTGFGTPTASTPALSPQATSNQAEAAQPRRPSAPSPGVDVDVDVDPSLSKAMPSQHMSQVEVKPPSETNRVDQVLNDVFNLLSLFFLTIGKTKESPGTYCQIASMRVSLNHLSIIARILTRSCQQLLDHMNQSGIYTQADLQPFAQRLQVLKQIIKKDKEEGRHPPAIVKLMMRKLEDSGKSLRSNLPQVRG